MGKRKKKGRQVPAKLDRPTVDRQAPAMETVRADQFRLVLRQTGAMRNEGLAFLSEPLLKTEDSQAALVQLANVASLPGLVGRALAMPDMHWGYGFPIGGVAAFDAAEGLVSPGGVGYDINCGCRLIATDLAAAEVRDRLTDLTVALFKGIPTGVGKSGPIKLSGSELKKALTQGAAWAVKAGFGRAGDLDRIEDSGRLSPADPAALSERALERGRPQLGTLGSGNHFLELDAVEEIFDPDRAAAFGLFQGQLVVQLHSGSRGLGYQVCDDNLKILARRAAKEGLVLPDRQLVYAPLGSLEAEEYFAAMNAAANYAFANRQVLAGLAEDILIKTLSISPAALNPRLVIDVCHNIAKLESHVVDGVQRLVCVHRKGATRAFAAGRSELPPDYRAVGQPVLIPGDMGRASYVLVGREGAMRESFGSTCHGAGRVLSRQAAKKLARGRSIAEELGAKGIVIMAEGKATLAEEMPEAYKDVAEVVEVVHGAGLSTKVARLRPLGVVKG